MERKCMVCGYKNRCYAKVCEGCGIELDSRRDVESASRRKRDCVGYVLMILVLLCVVSGAINVFVKIGLPFGGPHGYEYREGIIDDENVSKVRTNDVLTCFRYSYRNRYRNYEERCPPYDLGEELSCASAFRCSWEDFSKRHPKIRYIPDGKSRRLIPEDVRFFGREVAEVSLFFSSEGLVRADISVFNKGDDRSYLEEHVADEFFKDLLKTKWGGKVETSVVDDGEGKSIEYINWVDWNPKVSASVGMNIVEGVRAVEFLNFKISVLDNKTSEVSQRPVRNVVKDGDDIYIANIPMVNQGQKGYCVPATIERLLRYYEVNTDMHALALIMDTKVGGGTSIGNGFPSLTRIADELGMIRVDFCVPEVYNEKYFEYYNAAARNMGREELKIENFTVQEVHNGEVVNVRHYDWMADNIEKDVATESRLYDEAGFKIFESGITACINMGKPLLWSVKQVFPWEKAGDNTSKGHMRLIIGYNRKTREILYSDSWGDKHTKKRASIEDAWVVTDLLSCLSQ